MTFHQFLRDVQKLQAMTGWRYGQAAFNLLVEVKPDLAERVRATDMDPFYTTDNNRWINFVNFLKENWTTK